MIYSGDLSLVGRRAMLIILSGEISTRAELPNLTRVNNHVVDYLPRAARLSKHVG